MDVSWISIAYALAAALATALLWLGINPLMRWKLRHLPGPFAWPFIGNLPSIVRYGIHEYTVKVAHNYGPVALIWFGGDPTVVVSDPEMARKVLLRFNQRRRFPGVLRGEDYEVDRSGLVWAKDLHWRVARWVGGGVGGCLCSQLVVKLSQWTCSSRHSCACGPWRCQHAPTHSGVLASETLTEALAETEPGMPTARTAAGCRLPTFTYLRPAGHPLLQARLGPRCAVPRQPARLPAMHAGLCPAPVCAAGLWRRPGG